MRVALAFAGLLLPGLAWWLWLGDRRKDGAQALAEIVAVSASFIAVGTLGFYTVRLKVNALLLGVLLGLCFGLILAGLIRRGKGAFDKTWLLALFGLAIALAWRFWQARDLILPNWVDSQHHVLIIRKMIEFGGLPSTLEPYLPGPFYYHFGFHSVAALFSVLSGLDPAASVLMLGQAISACVGLTIYALAKQLSGDWRVGLLAGVFVTFVTKMPGYYLSWGRYTLLIGVMLLPAAMAEVTRVQKDHDRWWQMLSLSLLTAGVLLSHYFTAFLFVLFLVFIFFQWLIESIKSKTADWKALFSLVISTLIGLVLVSRWYYRIFVYSNAASRPALRLMEPGALRGSWSYFSYVVGPVAGYVLIALALVGLIWLVVSTKKLPLSGWAAAILFLSLPTGLRLMNFRYDYYALVVFIPIAAASAYALVSLIERFIKTKAVAQRFILLLGALIMVGGGIQNLNMINSETVLVTNSDLLALEWIEQHTPKTARFFINTVGWSSNTSRGTDGGGWILPITGRWTIVPTVFYPMSGDESFVRDTALLGERASVITECGEEFWDLVNDARLTYIYIKEGVGSLQPSALTSCHGVSQLVNIEGVHIYLIDRAD